MFRTDSLYKASLRRALRVASLCGCVFALGLTGCQTDISGQTLPSAYFLEDDVQYFAHGPDFILTNQVQAMERYKLQQKAVAADPGFGGGPAGPGGPAFP